MTMGFGRIAAIIGAAVGLLSVILSLILPELFCWYSYTITNMISSNKSGYYLTGFGTTSTIPYSTAISGIALLELIGGFIVILGAIICIVGVSKESKKIGSIGGILILLGPVLLLVDFLFGIGAYFGINEYHEYVAFIQTIPSNESILWGTFIRISWRNLFHPSHRLSLWFPGAIRNWF